MIAKLAALAVGVLVWGRLCIAAEVPALKEVFKDDFFIGAALNPRHISGSDREEVEIVTKHFHAITSENSMKWMSLHPEPNRYTFEQADVLVEFGQRHGMAIIGHTLVWHSQTPR